VSREELEQLTRYIQRTQKGRTSSLSVAREQLEKEGIVTPDGKLTGPYGGKDAA
jgi:hypothetical protein